MLKAKMLVGVGIAGIVAASAIATPALAWHPKGTITKKVQNITTGSALVDANTAADAVEVKPGDVIRYVITVTNTAEAADKQMNDMAFTKLTDTFPAGVELVDTPATRTVTADLGLIVPGKSVTKEYQLKVTSKTDGETITNKACFTGDSTVKDNPQAGCDDAVIKVKVPEVPVTPEEPQKETPKPEEPKKVTETPKELPKTGPEAAVLAGGLGLSSLGYAGYSYLRSRRELTDKLMNRR